MARYDLEDAQGHTPNHAVVPANINPPIMCVAPPELTVSSGELWLGISNNDPNYGGCYVWLSYNNTDFKQIAKHSGNATTGTLTANFTNTATTLAVDISQSGNSLASFSQHAFDVYDSLCLVGAELIAFRDATLTGSGTYTLATFHRALYNTSAGANSGAGFLVCDDNVLKQPFNDNLTASTVYLKFQGFNLVGGGVQDLSTLPVYSINLTDTGGGKPRTPKLFPAVTSQAAMLALNAKPADTAIRTDISKTYVLKTGGVASVLGDWAEVLSGGDGASSFNFMEVTKTITGIVPLLVTQFVLPAGAYTEVTAQMGTTNTTDTTSLQLKKADGTVLKTLSSTGVPAQVSTTGFTLASDTLVGFYMVGGSTTTQSFIFSIGVK